MIVKICGITRLDDAQAAIALGAGALGFVFWPKSPRFVDPYRARGIVRSLPPFVSAVGVFVNQDVDYVNGVATLAGLTAVQLHGDETQEYAALVRRPVIKAVAVGNGMSTDAWPAHYTLLADAHDPEQRGGTGRVVDWQRVAAMAASRRTLLAGGLTPENVRDAVAAVRPFGIDVSSGVEDAPGVKNRERLRSLFAALAEQGR